MSGCDAICLLCSFDEVSFDKLLGHARKNSSNTVDIHNKILVVQSPIRVM